MKAGLLIVGDHTIDDLKPERLRRIYISSPERRRYHHRVECLGTDAHLTEIGNEFSALSLGNLARRLAEAESGSPSHEPRRSAHKGNGAARKTVRPTGKDFPLGRPAFGHARGTTRILHRTIRQARSTN